MLEKTEEAPSARMPKAVLRVKKKNDNSSGSGGWETLSLQDALASLEEGLMRQPSVDSLVCIVCKCTKERNLAYALRLHAYMQKSGLEAHESLGNYLISMLVEVGSMPNAQRVFDRLASRNECSWNSLINGYIKCGESRHALILYQKMRKDSLHPTAYTFVALLKACAKLKDVERGREIHSEIAKMGLLETDPFVGSTLLDMYAKCGLLVKAREVFDDLPNRGVVQWNALIAGYAKHDRGEEALTRFEQMQLEGISPDAITFTCSLKACGSIGATDKGSEIHAEIIRKGLLKRDLVLGSALVDMYAKCGSLVKAQEVFDELPVRNVGSWNALIAGYAKHECGEKALNCFKQMHLEGVAPDAITFICSLKACGSIRAADKGMEIHAEIARKGLVERDHVIGSALVDMYVKCDLLAKAHEVFDNLPFRNVDSWNALISGYVEHELGEEALNCFKQMQFEGVSPDAITFACSLKACGNIGATDKGKELHGEIARKGLLGRDLIVGNALVDMYAKCGLLAQAQEVFDNLPNKDVISWNALMAGYAKHEHSVEALKCFEQMQLEGVSPDATTFACGLKACGSIGATDKGREIHDEIERKGLLERDLVVGNALVNMYAKCGMLTKAQEVFNKLPNRDTVSWNALIAGYAKYEHGEEALNCFEQMQHQGVSPDAVTFACSLKACGNLGTSHKGREIHAEIERNGLLERDTVVGIALVDMYAKCGLLAKAQEVFDKLPYRDVVLWNALIAGYAKHEWGQEALNCFERMQREGVSPSAVTFACSLKACGSLGATDKGREIHSEIERKGLLERDLVVGNALVDMYAKCGLLAKAKGAFDKLPNRDVVSWNSLIAGYVQFKLGEEALMCFEQMHLEGVSPDAITFACSLKACGSIGATDKGREIHAEIERKGLLERDLVVGIALIDMYAKCGLLAKAQEVFDKLPNRGVVEWNVLIASYAKCECSEEVLNCFEQMQLEGVSPDAVTLACSLKACGGIGATAKGREIHAQVERKGWLERDLVVGNALVDMYGKCGLIAKAQEVFDKLPNRDIVSWNTLIAGYAQLGESKNVFCIFYKMRGEGNKPDPVTFVSVLNACSHAGLVDEAQTCFNAMGNDYDITSTVEHHICMVDLLGRAGQLDRAVAMMKKLPFHPNVVMWCAVLGACRKWGNVELGRHAFRHAVQLDKKEAAAYVCMYNIYADADIHENTQELEQMRVKKQAWKNPPECFW